MLEACTLETRGSGARFLCSQRSFGYCKGLLNALILQARLLAPGSLPELLAASGMASLHLWLVEIRANLRLGIPQLLLEGRGAGELSRPTENSDFSVSHLPVRAQIKVQWGVENTSTLENYDLVLRTQTIEPYPSRYHLAGVWTWVMHCL